MSSLNRFEEVACPELVVGVNQNRYAAGGGLAVNAGYVTMAVLAGNARRFFVADIDVAAAGSLILPKLT